MTVRLSSEMQFYQRFLPSMTTTSTASRSKSSNSRALTLILGLSKSGFPVDQSGVSVKVPQPQTAQKWCLIVFEPQR